MQNFYIKVFGTSNITKPCSWVPPQTSQRHLMQCSHKLWYVPESSPGGLGAGPPSGSGNLQIITMIPLRMCTQIIMDHRTHTHTCAHARMHTPTHACTPTHTHAHTHARTHTCTHMHTYTRTHTHTHTHNIFYLHYYQQCYCSSLVQQMGMQDYWSRD